MLYGIIVTKGDDLLREAEELSFKVKELCDFDIKIRRVLTDKNSHTFEIDDHVHREFEVYINLSGDISFLVNNKLYYLSAGDVIIARPGEYHHCIYRSEKHHGFYWILLNCPKDHPLIKSFYSQHPSINYVSPRAAAKWEILDLCERLLKKEESDRFFDSARLFSLINQEAQASPAATQDLPEDLKAMLDFIYKNLSEKISVKTLSNKFFLSQSTVERRFKEYFDVRPLEFIQKTKLNYAADLLRSGESVLNAGLAAGYLDNSYFITLFTRYYKITPKQYKDKSNND